LAETAKRADESEAEIAAMPRPKPSTERLDDTFTASDLIWALEHLPFARRQSSTTRGRPNGSTRCSITIDKGFRDYLFSAVKARRGKSSS
jgi:hypothetical protein